MGLTHCSISEFKELFLCFLQVARVNVLDIDNGSFKDDTLSEVIQMLASAVESYHTMCTSGKWHISKSGGRTGNAVCWNCGKEGHI